jgi:hypothetical protein
MPTTLTKDDLLQAKNFEYHILILGSDIEKRDK